MIKSISIKNIALIENLKIDFFDGLNIITGETGAGKSILLSSIGLILGGKVGADIIRTGEQKASVEVVFDITCNQKLKMILEDSGLEVEENTLIVKREVSSEPRSRSFVNLQSVPNSSLKGFGEYLLDISGQHEHQSLLRQQTHLELLDNFAHLQSQTELFSLQFQKFQSIKKELLQLTTNEEEKERLLEMNLYAIEEIQKNQLQPDEDTSLEKELQTLNNHEKLVSSLETAYQYLYHQDNSIIPNTEKAIFELDKITHFDSSIEKSLHDLKEALYILEHVKDLVRSYKEGLEYSPDRIEHINQRLEMIKDLKRKYGNTISEILAYQTRCEEEIKKISSDTERFDNLSQQVNQKEEEIAELAVTLSKERQKAAKLLEKEIEQELTFLAMDKSSFKVEFRYIQDDNSFLKISDKGVKIEEKGIDRLVFKFSANPGEPPKSLVKIASGGELSRVMLAIKSILTEMDEIDTILFDEVDAGIGGETSIKVGKKIKTLSAKRQILCITHSPQIASLNQHHYKVEKFEESGRTKTNIRKLIDNEKIEEIARMLGGDQITEVSLQHAQELIEKTKN